MRKPFCNKKGTNKRAWSKQEDQKLVEYIRKHGEGSWRTIPQAAGLFRCGKSCRLRWINYLRPDLKRGNFAEDEEDLIIKLHALLGNRWSLIAGRLPGRTDNEVKNYWNSHLRRKLMNMGIDPNNHRLNHCNYCLLGKPQNSDTSFNCTSTASSLQKFQASEKSPPAEPHKVKPDTASCLEDTTEPNNRRFLPDLNLELIMTMSSYSSSSSSLADTKRDHQKHVNNDQPDDAAREQ